MSRTQSATSAHGASNRKPSDAVETARDEARSEQNTPKGGIAGLIDRVMKLKLVRVFQNYGNNGGPLLASGMSYQAVFAIFAAIWVGVSIFGAILKSDEQFRGALLAQLNTAVPGLIGDKGAISTDALLSAPALGWTGAIAALGLIWTAIGWLGSTRSAVRLIFNLPGPTTNFAILKLRDLALAIAFAVVLVISAALSIASSSALGFVFGLFGWDTASAGAEIIARVIGLVVVFVFDTIVLGGTYRVLSGVPIPFKQLLPGAALGAVVMGVLKVLGSSLLGGATSNPLLASFAVIIGILIWFNLICQVVLIFASWIAISMSDAGIDPRKLTPEEAEAEALQTEADAHRQVLEAQHAQVASELADARGLRRTNLRRQLKHIDREIAAEKSAPVIDAKAATPPPK
ncbi:YhjD/YihY/BrkB family envelope integrity protein [Subtercola vilae]|uniref:YihY/virulence factor BrkB family protein n=1 Tax=Subtercola vilae TaxID=2056433 RepID=A0A4T2BWA2_9MICO|nr:YhjD/YihY/BrkB family envelope integrity protein [Subtercola vilae]TIH33848.1 YihY/virulence factor BrkB family protein [Subtercola vilae]